jgi:hypothetical protein
MFLLFSINVRIIKTKKPFQLNEMVLKKIAMKKMWRITPRKSLNI